MSDQFFVPLILIAVGFGLLIAFIYLTKKRNRLLSTGIPVEGIVFDYVSRSGDDLSSRYPVIRFLTLQQNWITESYDISYPGFVLKRGQKVKVYYNPDKPSDFIVNLRMDKWILVIFLSVSILCLAWATVLLINVYK